MISPLQFRKERAQYAQISQQQPLDETWELFRDAPASPAPAVPEHTSTLGIHRLCSELCLHILRAIPQPALLRKHRHNQLDPSLANHRTTDLLRLESISWDLVVQPEKGQLQETTQHCIQSGFEHLQIQRLHLSGEPASVFNLPFSLFKWNFSLCPLFLAIPLDSPEMNLDPRKCLSNSTH